METEEERIARRRARIEEMKREKRRRELLYKWGVPAIAALAVAVGIGIGFGAAGLSRQSRSQQQKEETRAEGLSEETDSGSGQVKSPEDDGGESQADDPEGGEQADAAWESPPLRTVFSIAGKNLSDNVKASAQALGPAWISLTVNLQPPEPVQPPLADAAPAGIFHMSEGTEGFAESILSQYGIFVDALSGDILAQKDAYARMNPASMTKILTVLVAAEHLTEADLDQTAQITIDITDYSFANDCSNTGYALDEVVTVRDLFYGTILPSGADSALALAKYVAGSHEAFVDLMNEKLAQLGLAESSHFTNCVGLYDENHYTTAYDMAVILKATVDNPFCREVMSAHTYTTSLTEQHPEGLLVSNWFLRRIEDRDTHGEVLCAKTGFVDQSGSCAASMGVDSQGREYLCVTAGSNTRWTCIADHVELYQRFLPEIPQAGDEAP